MTHYLPNLVTQFRSYTSHLQEKLPSSLCEGTDRRRFHSGFLVKGPHPPPPSCDACRRPGIPVEVLRAQNTRRDGVAIPAYYSAWLLLRRWRNKGTKSIIVTLLELWDEVLILEIMIPGRRAVKIGACEKRVFYNTVSKLWALKALSLSCIITVL